MLYYCLAHFIALYNNNNIVTLIVLLHCIYHDVIIVYFQAEDIGPSADSAQTSPTCFEREQCQDTLSTSTLDVMLLCPGVNCPTGGPASALIYHIAAGVTAAVVVVLVLLIVLAAVVICPLVNRGIFKNKPLQENPTYESAGI